MSKSQPLVHVRMIRPDSDDSRRALRLGDRWEVSCDVCAPRWPIFAYWADAGSALRTADQHASSGNHRRNAAPCAECQGSGARWLDIGGPFDFKFVPVGCGDCDGTGLALPPGRQYVDPKGAARA